MIQIKKSKKAFVNVLQMFVVTAAIIMLSIAASRVFAKSVSSPVSTADGIKNSSVVTYSPKSTSNANTAILGNINQIFSAVQSSESNTKPKGYVTASIERFTIGTGYYMEPVKVPLYEGDNGAAIIARILGDGNYRNTGTIQSQFYLSSIKNDNAGIVNIPDYIKNAVKAKGGTLDTQVKTAGWLGEFDYYKDSGWLYMVNNTFGSVGMSEYTPKDGDVLRLQYSVYGLGSDIGNSFPGGPTPILTPANRDALTKRLGEINSAQNKAEILAKEGAQAAYNSAITVSENLLSTQDQIDNALKNLNTVTITDSKLSSVSITVDGKALVTYPEFNPDVDNYTANTAKTSSNVVIKAAALKEGETIQAVYSENGTEKTIPLTSGSEASLPNSLVMGSGVIKLQVTAPVGSSDPVKIYTFTLNGTDVKTSSLKDLSIAVAADSPLVEFKDSMLQEGVIRQASEDSYTGLSDGVYAYRSYVNYDIDKITVTASTVDNGNKLYINNQLVENGVPSSKINLTNVGDNPITILVKDSSGNTVDTYTLDVVRYPELGYKNGYFSVYAKNAAGNSSGAVSSFYYDYAPSGRKNVDIFLGNDATQCTISGNRVDGVTTKVDGNVNNNYDINLDFTGDTKNYVFEFSETINGVEYINKVNFNLYREKSYNVASSIESYQPAPASSSNINDVNSVSKALKDVSIGNMDNVLPLGGFGGYVSYDAGRGVLSDNPNNPYGVDFVIYTTGKGIGTVQVSEDGYTWYTIAGSKYYAQNKDDSYSVTYTNPDPQFTDYKAKDITWTDSKGKSGKVTASQGDSLPLYPNPALYNTITSKEYINQDSNSFTLAGTSYENAANAVFGYAGLNDKKDNSDYSKASNPYSSDTGSINGNGFDLKWAVDANGNPVQLKDPRYIRIINNTMDNLNLVGIAAVTPEANAVGVTDNPVVTVNNTAIKDYGTGEQAVYIGENTDAEISVTSNAANRFINNTRLADGVTKTVISNQDIPQEGLTVRVLVQDGNKEASYKVFKIYKKNFNAQVLADSITKITQPASTDTKITFPAVPEGYSIKVKSSSDPTAVDLEGNIKRTVDGADKIAKVVFEIKSSDGSDTGLTKEFDVRVCPTPQAGDLTSLAFYTDSYGGKLIPLTTEFGRGVTEYQLTKQDSNGMDFYVAATAESAGAKVYASYTRSLDGTQMNQEIKANTRLCLSCILSKTAQATVTIKVVPADSSAAKEYKVMLSRELSTNNNLSFLGGYCSYNGKYTPITLTQPDGTTDFNENVTNYTISPIENVETSWSATSSCPSNSVLKIKDSKGNVLATADKTGLGTNCKITFPQGETNFSVEVTAEDGSKKEYFIKAIVVSELKVKSMSVDSGYFLGLKTPSNVTTSPDGTGLSNNVNIPYNTTSFNLTIDAGEGSQIRFGGTSETEGGTVGKSGEPIKVDFPQNLDKLCDQKVYVSAVSDGHEIKTQLSLNFYRLSPYAPDSVYEINRGANEFADGYGGPETVLRNELNKDNMVNVDSIGGYGGYITYKYDKPVKNDPSHPYGVDFIVYGNAFPGNVEPGDVMVAQDKDGDGKPDKWYELAGSGYYEDDSEWNYGITYKNNGDNQFVTFKDSNNVSGTVDDQLQYSKFPETSYTKEGGYKDNPNEITFNGFRIGEKAPVTFGYFDTHPHARCVGSYEEWTEELRKNGVNNPTNPYANIPITDDNWDKFQGDGMDISWAVDENGKPVKLDDVSFVRFRSCDAYIVENNGKSTLANVSSELGGIARVADGSTAVGVTTSPSAIKINGKDVPLKEGIDEYDVYAGKDTTSAAIEVTSDANKVFINGTETKKLTLDKLVKDAGTTVTNALQKDGRVVQVILQDGTKEARIITLKIIPADQTTVETPVTGVTLDETASVTTGSSIQLNAKVQPDNASNKNVSWLSSDSSVAAVDQNGLVTGLKPGKSVITVTTADGNKTATCTVTVTSSEETKPIKISNLTEGTFKSGDDAKVSVKAENNSGKDQDVSLIVGLFDKNNKFINYVSGTQTIKDGDSSILTDMLKLPEEGLYKLKAFVWDSLDKMNPLSNVIDIPINSNK